ncbi:hypothetical protein OHA98_39990 [Streptomyces sp. NBC_00654]|uniref:hypothetical protein n=1 Tax=Streptomyces sp. NBC_00654 TaxID=2975799 RepID=UPI002250E744|nr:hypothetical protein [Streptomyces sp. NBC_00654]MCX4970825.1 hypothetical protein [Streptomyces sp. NBC_00654]
MGEARTGHEVHQEHEKLVRALADQHARTVAQDRGEGVPDEAFDVLMEHAQTLMAYEKQMPAFLAEPERVRSQKVIFWSWRVQSAVAIALIFVLHLLGYSHGWYFLVVPHLVATFCGWPLEATVKNHLARRSASIVLHAMGVVLVLVVLSPWFIVALLIGWAVIGTAVSDGQGAGK